MAVPDYYARLHLGRNASQDDLRSAYRKLAIRYHPDKNHGDKKKEDLFKELNEAYQVLSDENKRRRYDAILPVDDKSIFFHPEDYAVPKGVRIPSMGEMFVDDIYKVIDNVTRVVDKVAEVFERKYPLGEDKDGKYFAIPRDDVGLLSAMYHLREDAKKGESEAGGIYHSGPYEVSLNEFGTCELKVKESYWNKEKKIDPKYIEVAVDPDLLEGNKPRGFDNYFRALDSVSRGLSSGNNKISFDREREDICRYSTQEEVSNKFDIGRLDVKELRPRVVRGEGIIQVGFKVKVEGSWTRTGANVDKRG